jgi:hypothetical protein
MVIYRTADGQPGYHQAGELDEAVRFVERLRNGDGVDGARIFKMEEVNFDFRPYFKVEIGPGEMPMEAQLTAAPAPAATPAFGAGEPAFTADLGFDPEPAAGGYGTAETWAEPEVADAPVESAAALGLEPEPVFSAPTFGTDSAVIDALPSSAPAESSGFEPPSVPPVDLPADDESGASAGGRRGLFGR